MQGMNDIIQQSGFRNDFLAPITLTLGSAYATGQVMGGPILIDNVASQKGPVVEIPMSTILQGLVAFDPDAQSTPLDIFFFNQALNVGYTDKTAFTPNYADSANICGVASIVAGDWISSGSPAGVAAQVAGGANLQNLNRVLKPAKLTALYAVPVIRATKTFTTAGFQFRFQFRQI